MKTRQQRVCLPPMNLDRFEGGSDEDSILNRLKSVTSSKKLIDSEKNRLNGLTSKQIRRWYERGSERL